MNLSSKAKVLIVDDNQANLQLLKRILSKIDVDVLEASSGAEALEIANACEIALFLLDVQMPHLNGYGLANQLHATPCYQESPIIFLTAAFHDDQHRMSAYDSGAIDYMEKPINNKILLSKVKVLVSLWSKNQELKSLMDQLSIQNMALQTEMAERGKLEEKLKHMAMYDDLTNLPNRALLKKELAKILSYSERHQRKMAVMFLDLDGFKQINDNYGHESGDLVLIELAYRMEDTVRSSDVIARFGGDEFVVILPNYQGTDELIQIAERLLDSVSRPLHTVFIEQSLSTSIGIALFPEQAVSGKELISKADQAMYVSKELGKNKISFFSKMEDKE